MSVTVITFISSANVVIFFVSWMSSLEATKWLQYLSVLFRAACVIVNAMEKEGQSVLVHCTDGWDRTAQLVSLAEIIMDPYYRTIKVILNDYPYLLKSMFLNYCLAFRPTLNFRSE